MSPFDEPDQPYLVLSNAEAQFALWPARIAVPAGWSVAHGPGPRGECLGYVNNHWTDMRKESPTWTADAGAR